MENPILYIILNGELEMSGGKGAAQAVHAAMLLNMQGLGFKNHYKRTVIVLEAKNSQQLRNLHEYLNEAHINSEYYIDEGKNEVDAFSITALVVEPIFHADAARREIFEAFPLFTGKHRQEDEPYKTSIYSESIDRLNEIQRWNGYHWYVGKTIKWLKKQ